MSSAITAAVGGAVVGSLLSDDNGAEEANEAAVDNTRLQSQIAKDQWDKYKEIYQPLEREMVDEAKNWLNQTRLDTAAGEAAQTVSSQFSKARDELSRQPGMDPSSAAFQTGMIGLNLAEAANSATAQNSARKTVEDTAYTRKQSALALGKGLDATAASGLSSAASASLAQANAGYERASQGANAIGSLTGKAISALPGLFTTSPTPTVQPTSSGASLGVDASSLFDDM